MSLNAILRSVMSENYKEDMIEEYVVELYDKNLPHPHLGGVAGIRVVNRTDMTDDYRININDWKYDAQKEFDVSTGGGEPNYVKELNRLDKIASDKYQAESLGETFEEMFDHFTLVGAPFKVEGVYYPIDTPEKAKAFSRDLDRKFGTDKRLEFEKILALILAQNERPNVFNGERIHPTVKGGPTPKAEPQYSDWAMFS